MKIIFFNQPSKEFIISIGLLLSGSLLLLLNQYFFYGEIDTKLYFYPFLVYFFLRILEILDIFITKLSKEPLLGFSYSFLFLILIILFFGIFNLSLPIKFITFISIIDIIVYFFNNSILKVELVKKFLIGFFLGLFLIFFSTFNTYSIVITEDLINLGFDFSDTLRDAAVANSWDEYSVISHGIHGLLFEPYHFLFAIFSKPFINNEFNIFNVFLFYAYLLIPSISFFGLSKVLKLIGNDVVAKSSIFITILFILTFYNFEYVISQRSYLIATLLMIPFIPIFYNQLIKTSSNITTIIIFGTVCLVMIIARAHHGVFVSGFLLYFFLVSKKPYEKICYILFFIFSILLVYIYYGATSANAGKPLLGYLKYFSKGETYISSFLLPLLIFLTYLVFDKKIIKRYSFFKDKGFNKNIKIFLFFLFLFSIFLILRPFNVSDVFYSMSPIYFFLILIGSSKKITEIFVSTKNLEKIIKRNLFKNFLILIIIFVSLETVKNWSENFYKNSIHIIKQIRIINNQWNYDGGNKFLIKYNDNILNFCTKKSDYFCKLRTQILSVNNLKKLSQKSLPFNINKKVKEVTKEMKGVTAVYINPKNDFWSFFNSNYHFNSSLYLMSVGKIPLIFGAHPKDTGLTYGKRTVYGYSIITAHKNEGTLKDISEIGNDKTICKIAQKVKVENIIIFKEKDSIERIIICNKNNYN